jgi:hypothetical protein
MDYGLFHVLFTPCGLFLEAEDKECEQTEDTEVLADYNNVGRWGLLQLVVVVVCTEHKKLLAGCDSSVHREHSHKAQFFTRKLLKKLVEAEVVFFYLDVGLDLV